MVAYGDNIFEIIAVTQQTLRLAEWPTEKVDAIVAKATGASSYDAAVDVCREYITIRDDRP